MTALPTRPAPYLPSLRELRAALRTHLRALLTPDAERAHRQATLDRTLHAEQHHARIQRSLLTGGPR